MKRESHQDNRQLETQLHQTKVQRKEKREVQKLADLLISEANKLIEEEARSGFKPRSQLKPRKHIPKQLAKAIRLRIGKEKDSMTLNNLNAVMYIAYSKTANNEPLVKRNFSLRAKLLDAKINKLQAIMAGKVEKTKAQEIKKQLKVRSRKEVIAELNRLKEIRDKARDQSKTYSRKRSVKSINDEAERFSRFRRGKEGRRLQYEEIEDPKLHVESWSSRWAIPVDPDPSKLG